MKTALVAALLTAAALNVSADTTDVDKAKRTMMDVRTIATAIEAYATDHNIYPVAKAIEDVSPVVMPVYIRTMPEKDSWGTSFRYWSDGSKYRIVSCGADATCDETTWSNISSDPMPSFNDDAVYENGKFLRFWSTK